MDLRLFPVTLEEGFVVEEQLLGDLGVSVDLTLCEHVAQGAPRVLDGLEAGRRGGGVVAAALAVGGVGVPDGEGTVGAPPEVSRAVGGAVPAAGGVSAQRALRETVAFVPHLGL